MAQFYILFYLLAYLGPLASGVHEYDEKTGDQLSGELEEYLKTALEHFRGEMGTGIPEMKIPPLEPLVLKDMAFNYKQDPVNIELKLQEVRVSGLSSFDIRELRPSLPQLSVKLGLGLQTVTISGHYDITGKIMNIFPIYGKGPYKIIVQRPSLLGAAKLVLGAHDMKMNRILMDFDWENLETKLDNLMGGGNLSEVLNRMIPLVGKRAFDAFRPDIQRMLGDFLADSVNKQLQDPEVKKLVQQIIVHTAGAISY